MENNLLFGSLFQYKPEMEKMDPDHLFGLVLEVIPITPV